MYEVSSTNLNVYVSAYRLQCIYIITLAQMTIGVLSKAKQGLLDIKGYKNSGDEASHCMII